MEAKEMNKLESYKKALEEISDMQTPNGPIDSRLRAFYNIQDIAKEVLNGRCQKCLGSGYNGQCIYSGKCIACDGTGESKRFIEEKIKKVKVLKCYQCEKDIDTSGRLWGRSMGTEHDFEYHFCSGECVSRYDNKEERKKK